MAISDTWLKANLNKPRKKTEVKSDRDGLGARISPKGKIVFQLRYRYANQAKRVDVGTYPLMSLKEARMEVMRLRSEQEKGNDPKHVLMQEKFKNYSALSLEALFHLWYENYCKEAKKGHVQILRSYEIHVFPRIGKLPADKISLHVWLELLEGLAVHYTGITTRILTNSKQMYKWAIKRHLLDNNPLADIMAVEDLKIRKNFCTRTLDPTEIYYLWEAMNRSRMQPKAKAFIKLCLLYGCRTGELRVAEKTHFDFKNKVWRVPPENHKVGKQSGRAILRPIIPATEELIKEAMKHSSPGKYLFNNHNSSVVMGRSAPLQWPYNIREWLRRHKNIDMPTWSMHDLRRTARTNLSSITTVRVCDVMLGRKLPGQDPVYDQYDYLPEQELAYSKWWERLQKYTSELS